MDRMCLHVTFVCQPTALFRCNLTSASSRGLGAAQFSLSCGCFYMCLLLMLSLFPYGLNFPLTYIVVRGKYVLVCHTVLYLCLPTVCNRASRGPTHCNTHFTITYRVGFVQDSDKSFFLIYSHDTQAVAIVGLLDSLVSDTVHFPRSVLVCVIVSHSKCSLY